MIRPLAHLTLVLALMGCPIAACGCGSDSSESAAPRADAATDATGSDAGAEDATPDAVEPDAQPDVQADVPIEAGPASCEAPCATSCADDSPFEGECAACAESVCAEHQQRAEDAPNRDLLYDCFAGCGTQPGCADDCCGKYASACAYAMVYQYCTCGFPESACTDTCADSCGTTGLTQSCGVCASQSPCALTVFDYLFTATRYAHQDCVDTCTSSSLSLDECLDRCRDDHPVPGEKYDAFLACVCGD